MKKDSGRLGYFFVVMFVFNMAANFVHPVTPAIIVDLQLNDYMFGLALAAMMAFNFLFSPFWGKIAGYLSSKKVLLICGFGYALGQVFFGLARTETQFLLARMFAGIFVGGCYVAFLTYTVNVSPEEKRGRNLAINATVNSVSASFGYFVGGMVGEINIFYSVWLQAATLAVTSVLLYIGCGDDQQNGLRKLKGRQLLRDCNPFAAILQCRHFMTKALVFLFLAYGLGNLGYIAFEQCFNYFLRDQFQLTSGYNGVIKAALGVISMVSNATLCMWILRRRSISPYIAGVMGVCTAAMIGVIFFENLVPFIVVNVLFFAFYFISVPLMQNRAAVLGSGSNSNLVMGAFNAMKSFGSIFGSALAGFLYEYHPRTPFVFGFAAFALAALMALMMARAERTA
ncbi:MAG: MFS transporter [Clostridiales bacterium]|nr:MFS transporter [Clostridiales bacterium]